MLMLKRINYYHCFVLFQMNYQRMLGQVANIEWNMSKSRLVAQMNEVGKNPDRASGSSAIPVNPDPIGCHPDPLLSSSGAYKAKSESEFRFASGSEWIRIKMIRCIRIRINLQMTSQTVWNMSISNKNPVPCLDPHQIKIRIRIRIHNTDMSHRGC
jgi:hypothetical protein